MAGSLGGFGLHHVFDMSLCSLCLRLSLALRLGGEIERRTTGREGLVEGVLHSDRVHANATQWLANPVHRKKAISMRAAYFERFDEMAFAVNEDSTFVRRDVDVTGVLHSEDKRHERWKS